MFRAEAQENTRRKYSPKSREQLSWGDTRIRVFWEIFKNGIHAIADQQGIKPILVHYGRFDAIGDVIFDLLGANLVVMFGRQALSNVVESITDESDEERPL